MSTTFLRVVRDPLFPIVIEHNEMAVFYNDQKAHSVLGPGSYRRVFQLPLTGIKTLVKFNNTEWTLEVGDVQLSVRDDELGTNVRLSPKVHATATLKLMPDAVTLRAAADRFTPDEIAGQIDAAAKTAIRSHLRQRLERLTHSQLCEASDLQQFVQSDEISILDGLAQIQRFTELEAVADAHAVELTAIRKNSAVDAARLKGEQDALDVTSQREAIRDAQRLQTELVAHAQIAAMTGLSIEVVRDPSLLSAALANKHELALSLINNPDTIKALARTPQVLQSILASSSSVQSPGVPSAPVALGGGAARLALGTSSEVSRVLEGLDLDDYIRGSSFKLFVARGNTAAEGVLVSDDVDLVRSEISTIQIRLSKQVGVETMILHVVPYEETITQFVEGYYRVLAPPSLLGYRSLVVHGYENRDGRLRIIIGMDLDGQRREEVLFGDGRRRQEQLQSLLMARQLEIAEG